MAHIPRIHLGEPLEVGLSVALPPSAQKHVLKVLRLRAGDAVELFNGDGQHYAARIQTDSKHATVVVQGVRPGPRRGAAITLALGVSRGDRMDYALQKSTELGVAVIQPLWTERGNTRIPADRLQKKWQHWHNIVVSASEQCGRCDVPVLQTADAFSNWIENASPGFVLTPEADDPLCSHPAWEPGDTTVLIGPESGLGEREVVKARELGWVPASLGPLVLRTETAASVAVAALRMRDGML